MTNIIMFPERKKPMRLITRPNDAKPQYFDNAQHSGEESIEVRIRRIKESLVRIDTLMRELKHDTEVNERRQSLRSCEADYFEPEA